MTLDTIITAAVWLCAAFPCLAAALWLLVPIDFGQTLQIAKKSLPERNPLIRRYMLRFNTPTEGSVPGVKQYFARALLILAILSALGYFPLLRPIVAIPMLLWFFPQAWCVFNNFRLGIRP